MDTGLMPSRTKILIKGWSSDVMEDDVIDALALYGELQDIFIPRDAKTQKAQSVGWVDFRHPEDAQAFMSRDEEVFVLDCAIHSEWWATSEVTA